MKARSFWTVLGFAVITAAVVGVVSKGGLPASAQPRFAPEASAVITAGQGGMQRVWRQPAWQRVATLGPSQGLYGPLHLEAGADGGLYVVDYGDLTVKEFRDGKLVRNYGHGRGQGPGEFAAITDLSLGPAGELWVADHANARLTVFDAEGGLKATLRPSVRPYRLAATARRGFFLMQPSGAELFGQFDPAGRLLRTFGRMVERQEAFPLVLDGWIKPAADDGFVYAGHFAGLLGGYDHTGRQRFLVETVSAQPLPKLVRGAEGKMWVDRESEASSWSLSVAGEEIHLLSAERKGVKIDRALDTYRLRDGKYEYSRPVPEECDEVVVSNGSLYTITATTVTRWRSTAS